MSIQKTKMISRTWVKNQFLVRINEPKIGSGSSPKASLCNDGQYSVKDSGNDDKVHVICYKRYYYYYNY